VRRPLGCLLAGFLLLPWTAAPAATAADHVDSEPVIIRFDPLSSASERAAALRDSGLTPIEEQADGEFVLAAPSEVVPVAAGAIDEITLPVTYRAMGVPNDPGYEFQWHLPAIDAHTAWDVTTGLGTVVAVLDTGAAYRDSGIHMRAPDLAGTRFVPGFDFVDGDVAPDDESGHGTHVTSTIAATTNNGLGVAGVAPGATIMPIRVLDAAGSGSDWAAAQGVRFAVDHGADIINMSFGSPNFSSVMADAIAYARGRDVTVVAATGNGDANGIGGAVSYPAAMPGVIGVGAVRYDRKRATYSNFGPDVDLVAPGGDVTVDQNADGYGDGILQETLIDGPGSFGYGFISGTSMAAPQVSAVAALLISRGVEGPDAIEAVLESTAVDLGPPGRDDEYGAGLLQSGAAVRSTQAPPARGITNACPPGVTPPSPFTDISSSVHAAAIGCVAWWNVASGKTATTFQPNGNVTRAQLASFVARELVAAGSTLPAAPPDAFTDDESSVHELAINQLSAVGVVQGRGGTTYAPNATVTRAEMATFLVRAHDLVDAPLAAGPDRFVDDETSVHETNINKVGAAGLAAGVGPVQFAPTAPVLRGQMATFLARLLDLLVASGATAPR
jgi:subtilisin family serine protease